MTNAQVSYILIYIQQDATLHSLFYLETTLHVSGGTTTQHHERIQLYLQHLVFVTFTAICRYRGRVGTGLSVLWVAMRGSNAGSFHTS
jgi:hypothetical protein